MSCDEWKEGRCVGCKKASCMYWDECHAECCTMHRTGPARSMPIRTALRRFARALTLKGEGLA
jgi:hypothetical protein